MNDGMPRCDRLLPIREVRNRTGLGRSTIYRMMARGVESRLLVHLTSDGLVTDVDVVDE